MLSPVIHRAHFNQNPNIHRLKILKSQLLVKLECFSTALIYYGLTLNSNTLSTDLFTTFTIGETKLIP